MTLTIKTFKGEDYNLDNLSTTAIFILKAQEEDKHWPTPSDSRTNTAYKELAKIKNKE